MSDQDRLDTEQLRALAREFGRPALGWLLVIVGVVLLIVGWFGVSREALVARQLPYFLSGGLGGLAAVLVGVALVAGNDLRRFSGRLRRLEEQLSDLHEVLLVEPSGLDFSGNGSSPDEVAVLPDGERYHHTGCPVVQEKDGVEQLDRGAARQRGLTPCKLCHDDVSQEVEGGAPASEHA